MAIPKELLTTTLLRAIGFCPYGGPGMRKTFAIHTLPPPILLLDYEGGAISLLPWIRRMRRWDTAWVTTTDQQRADAFNSLSEENQVYVKTSTRVNPGPLVDVIFFESDNPTCYEKSKKAVTEFNVAHYNSLAVDSMHEFAYSSQVFAKEQKNIEQSEPMHVKAWGPAQERARIMLKQIRRYRDQGIFVYVSGAEQIHKDFVVDPRESSKPETPHNVYGSVEVPGKLVNDYNHLFDIVAHSRLLNGEIVWVPRPEALTSGDAYWYGKDRTGRIKSRFPKPNIRTLLDEIYGKETRNAIYSIGEKAKHNPCS